MVGGVVGRAGGYAQEVVFGHCEAVDDTRNESESKIRGFLEGLVASTGWMPGRVSREIETGSNPKTQVTNVKKSLSIKHYCTLSLSILMKGATSWPNGGNDVGGSRSLSYLPREELVLPRVKNACDWEYHVQAMPYKLTTQWLDTFVWSIQPQALISVHRDNGGLWTAVELLLAGETEPLPHRSLALFRT